MNTNGLHIVSELSATGKSGALYEEDDPENVDAALASDIRSHRDESAEQSAEEAFALGLRAMQQGELDSALDLFQFAACRSSEKGIFSLSLRNSQIVLGALANRQATISDCPVEFQIVPWCPQQTNQEAEAPVDGETFLSIDTGGMGLTD